MGRTEQAPEREDRLAAADASCSVLRVVLARAGLPKPGAVRAALGRYQVGLPAGAWIDIHAAASALHAARARSSRSARGGPGTGPGRLPRAQAPVPGRRVRNMGGPMRARLAIGLARACECLAQAYARNGEPQLGVDLASQAVAAQPLRESAHGALTRAHLAAGNRAEALRAR